MKCEKVQIVLKEKNHLKRELNETVKEYEKKIDVMQKVKDR